MTDDHGSSRRYSDEEVKLLLKRAAELESEKRNLPARSEGPTLSDLESIASEAGINPDLIRRAARELDSTSTAPLSTGSGGSAFFGAPLSLEIERTVQGEASQETLERLLPIIQRAADGVGMPTVLGKTLTWQSQDDAKMRTLLVTVSVGRGETRIGIEERYGNLAGSLFGGIMGGGGTGLGLGVGLGVGLGALGSAMFATLFPIGIMGAAYALSRSIYRHTVHGRMRALAKLMNELVATVEDGLEDEA